VVTTYAKLQGCKWVFRLFPSSLQVGHPRRRAESCPRGGGRGQYGVRTARRARNHRRAVQCHPTSIVSRLFVPWELGLGISLRKKRGKSASYSPSLSPAEPTLFSPPFSPSPSPPSLEAFAPQSLRPVRPPARRDPTGSHGSIQGVFFRFRILSSSILPYVLDPQINSASCFRP
jgi:hypothetical protein